MHTSNELRSPVIEAFDCGYPSPVEVIEQLGGSKEAKHIFGRLWYCSDILPGDVIDYIRLDWPDCERMRGTYGALAQWMLRYMKQ